MDQRVNFQDWKEQAAHFDRAAPFVPGAQFLRAAGFRVHYILKDYLIGQAFGALGLRQGAKVLDVGCGRGVLLDRLGVSYRTVGFGIDVSAESLRQARREAQSGNQVARSDARRMPFADDSFDLVVSMDVLEHIPESNRAIDEMVRVIRPGGTLVCYAVSKRNRYTFNWFLETIALRLGTDLRTRACHEPELLIDPSVISSRLSQVRCPIESREPFHAFFTLAFDQGLLAFYWLATKLGVFGSGTMAARKVGRWILQVGDWVCRASLRPLRRLDAPWFRHGLSNGVLLIAKKRRASLSGQGSGAVEAKRSQAETALAAAASYVDVGSRPLARSAKPEA